MDPYRSIGQKMMEKGVFREVRMFPSGNVVVVDEMPDGTTRATHVRHDGKFAQATETTPRKAWLAARKAAS